MPDTIYGRNPVLEALLAREALDEILVAEGAPIRGPLGRIVALARDADVPVRHVPRAALDRAAGAGVAHQGVVAVASDYSYHDLAEILAIAIRRGEAPFLLALDAIQDVHNLGSLIRTAEAAGAHGILLTAHHAAGVTPAVRKASAGAVAHLAIARVDLPEALDTLRARGVRIVGLDEDTEDVYTDIDLTGALAVVVGGEGRGLSRPVANRCDRLVRLPMHGHITSLNAAVAGSIVLYEALRQRALAPQSAGAPSPARPVRNTAG